MVGKSVGKKEEIRAYIKSCSSKKIFIEITAVYGSTTVSYDTVRRWKKKFDSGLESVENTPKSGRPKSTIGDKMVSKEKEIVERSARYTVRDVPTARDATRKFEGIRNQRNQNVMLQQKCTNAPSRPAPRELGIDIEKPKFPQYALPSKRLESYDSWPACLPVTKEDLAEAGLVYTGVEDNVRCYYCGGGLRNWEAGDVPMEEHAKWYPKCPHILLVKGQGYIDRLLRGKRPETVTGSEPQDQTPGVKSSKQDHLESVAARSCLDMGFSKDIVLKAIHIYLKKNNGNATFRGKDLCEIIFDLDDDEETMDEATADKKENIPNGSESVDELFEENDRLKKQICCKICLDKVADVIFLPCGHMVSCPQCSPALIKCLVCRKTINGRIKALFAVMPSKR